MTPFDSDRFVADCVALIAEANPLSAIAELVKRTVASPNEIQAAYPPPFDPDEDGVLFRSPDLTVNYAIFPETFTTGIHDHQLPAVIGVWAGAGCGWRSNQARAVVA